MIPRKIDAIVEITALENPRIPNFNKKSDNFIVFGHFLGLNILDSKSLDQNFDKNLEFRTFKNLCIPNFSKIGGHLKIG